MDKDLVYFLLAQASTAIGVYAAIRADLREFRVRLGFVEEDIKGLQHAKH